MPSRSRTNDHPAREPPLPFQPPPFPVTVRMRACAGEQGVWRGVGEGGQFWQKAPNRTTPKHSTIHDGYVTSRDIHHDQKGEPFPCSPKAGARKFAKRLTQENEKGRPWREIADDFPMLYADGKPIVKAGTLSRIAKEKGEYMPSKKEILAALGLYKPRLPYPRPSWLFKWYHKPKEERYEVMKSHVEKDHEEQRRQKKETRKILEWLQ